MNAQLSILVVEDSENDFSLLMRNLQKNNLSLEFSMRVETENQLTHALENNNFNLIISDNNLPYLNANQALKVVRSYNQTIPFIIVSGTIPHEGGVQAMYEGANDYLLKSELHKLIPVIHRELRESQVKIDKEHTEKQLEASQESYQLLARSINDVFFAIDNNLVISYWNEDAAEELEYKADHAINKCLYDLFPELIGSNLDREIQRALYDQKSHHTLVKYQKKDGDKVEYFDSTIYPSNAGASIILKKVTDKRNTERALRKTNKELQTLLYRLSHDIKGPLASIVGLINLAKMDFDDPKLVKLLAMQEKSALNLQKTLDELMNISKMKGGKPNIEEILIKELIEDLVENAQNRHDANIDFKLEISANCIIHSDFMLLKSVLQNLLENAVKYRNGDSVVIEITAVKRKKSLHITIKDDGLGIDPDQQDKVFNMFYRASQTSEGSGLGLYIVKDAIEKVHGKVELASERGVGTTFTLNIPDIQQLTSENGLHNIALAGRFV